MFSQIPRVFKIPYVRARRGIGYLLFERSTGARTDGVIRLADLELDGDGYHDSIPSPYLPLRRLLRRRSVTPADVFVDFGAGTGRVVCQAAMYPFGRVIGVELAEEISAKARVNVARHRGRRARSVEIVTSDAAVWPIPDDLSVAYFYNPFQGDVFRRVIERIFDSYDQNPRQIRILYVNPVEHNFLMSTGRIQPLKHLRGWRPRVDWSRSNSARSYIVR